MNERMTTHTSEGDDAMKYKSVWTYDEREHKIRMFRILWQRGVVGVNKGGYSAKLSLSLVPKLFSFYRNGFGWRITFIGIQLHHLKSWGGIIC